MSRQVEKFRKLFYDTLFDGIFVSESFSTRDIVEECEKQGKLYSYKGLFIAPVRSTYNNADCIRIVFVIKSTDNGKVQDVDKVLNLLKDIEDAFTYVDICRQINHDGYMYIDTVKKVLSTE
ncbi:MAG: hypothetical protein QXG00_06060 [Candidatus Woesearchaeota archaeon]